MKFPKVNPNAPKTVKASLDLAEFLDELEEKHQLTYCTLLLIVSQWLTRQIKHQLTYCTPLLIVSQWLTRQIELSVKYEKEKKGKAKK